MDGPGGGGEITSVASGPNKGYWYVKSATWNMRRIGNVTPGIRIESPRVHASLPTTKKCKSSSQLRNFYRYNQECQGINMVAFVNGAMGHEGFGYNGGRGHEGLAQAAAREPGNDPYAVHYAMVEPDSATLALLVQARAIEIAEHLSYRSDDDATTEPSYPIPGNNWGPGTWWIWPPTQVRYDAVNINGF